MSDTSRPSVAITPALVAEHGRRALELLESRGGDVAFVLLDLTMPELGGEETLALLRARCGDVPVIFMSGFTRDAVHAAEGAPELLEKPYALEDLAAAIDRACSRRSRVSP